MAKPVVIVGGGPAGLACAMRLKEKGVDRLVLEASDRPGGHLKTDTLEGYRLDRGFQVLFTAYPTAKKLLDYDRLNLGRFSAGARIFDGKRFHEVSSESLWETATSPWLKLGDKLRMLALVHDLKSTPFDELWSRDDMNMVDELRRRGFSDRFVERFAGPFFSGVFLDDDLSVSRAMFLYVWKTIAMGDTTVPNEGIEAIPRQMAEGEEVRTEAKVAEILRTRGMVSGVRLESGETIDTDCVVVAADSSETTRLTGVDAPVGVRKTINVYFEAPESPIPDPTIMLNATGSGRVNSVSPMTQVAPGYGGDQTLISVTLVGEHRWDDVSLAKAVRSELESWFPGDPVRAWRPLAVYRVEGAQYAMNPGFREGLPGHTTDTEGLFVAGEFTDHSSLEGAMASGVRAADRVLEA